MPRVNEDSKVVGKITKDVEDGPHTERISVEVLRDSPYPPGPAHLSRLEEQIWTEGLNEIVSPGHRAPWRLAKAVVVDSGKESSYTWERPRAGGGETHLKLSRYGTDYLAHMYRSSVSDMPRLYRPTRSF